MNTDQIIEIVNEIFIDVLENDNIKLSKSTTASDIEEWDSLNHIQLVVAIEKKFKQRFSSQEISGWKNVGDMCEDINKRINQ